ncbi:HAMP domain-containing protein [Rossellomorea vietnamensis]|uniref:HAMP domain-containing protein n=1 Tax=Rossellomorea vietnamensis TaxID=218284 RepID=A0A5D4MFL3_9BACI|nr:HAMP domain-containing methyl-accepting chemotaxis protein [Rossellomorea vietnamensis]TYR99790.1 HAMP domain-containing protein [Rossellomorea vietnamensis]
MSIKMKLLIILSINFLIPIFTFGYYSFNYLSSAEVRTIFTILGIMLVYACIQNYFVIKSIARPLRLTKGAMEKIAEGDLNTRLDITQKNELGDMARSLNKMTANIKEMIQKIDSASTELAVSAESLTAVSEETAAASEGVSQAVQGIAAGSAHSAQEADEASRLIGSLSDQLAQVHSQAENISSFSSEANKASETGLEKMRHLNDSFEASSISLSSVRDVVMDLDSKIRDIEQVILSINAISEQTNLLALNASIEAARAGEQGKGFAVVAEEVRKLAEQSALATDRVKGTIISIQSQSKKAVEEMNKTKDSQTVQSKSVAETLTSFETIASVFEKVSDSIITISKEVQQINSSKNIVVESISGITNMTKQSAAACQEAGASTEEQVKAFSSVTHTAEQLNESSRELKKLMNYFSI